MKHAWLVLALFCSLAPRSSGAAPADAQPPAAVMEEARRHFLDGSKAYNLGEFARAVEEYKAAYNWLPDPSFLYNIAQAYRLSGDLTQALFFYRSYLRNLSPGATRREVELHIQQIEQQLARQNAIVTAPPQGAKPPSHEVSPPQPAEVTPPQIDQTPQPTIDATAPPPMREPTPAYKKGWVWGVVVVSVLVVAGVGVGLGVGLTRGNTNAPSTDVGTNKVFSLPSVGLSFGGAK